MKIKDLILWGGVIGMLSMTSCNNNEDLYDPAQGDALLKAEYSAKFFAKFGNVPANYSWDATSAIPQYKATRADKQGLIDDTKWYSVQSETIDWLNGTLKEEKNNKHLGKEFSMTVPPNKFTIVPIYQGKAGMEWEFHMVIGTGGKKKDIKVWSKSQNIQYRDSEKKDWRNVSNLDKGTSQNTINKKYIQAKEYTFDYSERAGELMYFYLKITQGLNDAEDHNRYAITGTNQSSLKGMMLHLDCPRPGNIEDKNRVMIVGCEDANLQDSDWDMNDVVFLIYGDPEIPEPIEIINGEVKEITSKRYMIEDLGSTDDFDFNDIVLDVTQEVTTKITTTNGVITNTEPISTTQKATLRHQGGTLPFSLWIGDKQLFNNEPGRMGATYADGEREFDLEGKWEPENNNIKVAIKDKNNGELVHVIEFPKEGEAPMIIAVNPKVSWMDERVSITKTWFDGIDKNPATSKQE